LHVSKKRNPIGKESGEKKIKRFVKGRGQIKKSPTEKKRHGFLSARDRGIGQGRL